METTLREFTLTLYLYDGQNYYSLNLKYTHSDVMTVECFPSLVWDTNVESVMTLTSVRTASKPRNIAHIHSAGSLNQVCGWTFWLHEVCSYTL